MPKQFYNILIVLLIFEFFLSLITKADIAVFNNQTTNASIILVQRSVFLLAVSKFILLLIHFSKLKMWLIFSCIVALLLSTFAQNAAFSAALERSFVDFSTYHLLRKINFWIEIALAVSFILADKGRYGLLAFYGASLAIVDCLLQVYFVSADGAEVNPMMLMITFVPGLLLIIYFIAVRVEIKQV